MGYLSDFFDSMAYGAATSTARNTQDDINNLDKAMAQRSITPQVYEEEMAKAREKLNTVSENAMNYSGHPAEFIASLSPEEKVAFATGYVPPMVTETGNRYDTSVSPPTLIEPVAPKPSTKKSAEASTEGKPKTYRDIYESLTTEGDKREFMRQMAEKDKGNKRTAAMQYASQLYPLGSEEHNRTVEALNSQIENSYAGMDLRRTEDTPQFKRASEQFDSRYRQLVSVLADLNGQIQQARSLKTDAEKTRFTQTEIPKMLNTLAVAAPDAVGVEEGKRIMAELSTIFNTNITQWGDLIQIKDWDIFKKNPDAFLEKAAQIYNIAAKNKNYQYDQWHDSLGNYGMKMVGAVKLNPIKSSSPDDPANIQAIKSGQTVIKSPFMQQGAPASSVLPSSPMKGSTIKPTGVRLYGPNEFQGTSF